MGIELSSYLNQMKIEINDKTTHKSSTKYYQNAIKDLTQTQRTHLIQIINGNLGTDSPEAQDILTSLKNYKEAYDAAEDKNSYMTTRHPPREKSWFKSIARALSNWGSRVSSEKVLNKLIKTDLTSSDIDTNNSPVMSEWLSQFQNNYLAHAVGTNTKKILDGEILKPSEMILREGVDVEYEMGAEFGQRGTTRLPKLTENELQSLQNVLFSNADKSRLEAIIHDPGFENSKTKYKELSLLRKELDRTDDDDENAASLFKDIRNRSGAPELDLYLEYTSLKRKQNGLRALFSLKDKSTGVRSPQIDVKTKMAAQNVIDRLRNKYHCTEKEILIAFDESQPHETRIDTYLRKKFNDQKYTQNKLAAVRTDVLRTKKLNQEIRMSEDKIFWGYGNVVILLGGDKSHVRDRSGREAILNTPIVSEDFHTINLKTTDNILILGPKADLEPFKAEYGDKIVYIEDLTTAQKDALEVPENLRT